jgi:hypothetical protein
MRDGSRHTEKEKVKIDSTLRSDCSNFRDAVAVENS